MLALLLGEVQLVSLVVSFTGSSGFLSISRAVKWLHSWEKHHFFNIDVVCQKHGESVDSHSPTSSWRQSVLKSSDEALVNMLSLIISIFASLSLLDKFLKLNLRVIQLSISIDNLVAIGE